MNAAQGRKALALKGVYAFSGIVAPDFGTILDFKPETSIVKFSESLALEVGSYTKLRFTTTDATKAPLLEARVSARRDESYARVYRFQHRLDKSFLDSLSPELRRLFELRSEPRKRPNTSTIVRIGVLETGVNQTGRMVDLSTRGLGVLLPPGSDAALVHSPQVQITFQLGSEPPYAFAGNIRRRELVAKGVLYGIEFDLKATHMAESLCRRLERFLTS